MHLRSLLGYVPQSYSGKITLFQSRWSLARAFRWHRRWRTVADGGLDMFLLPGNHDSFVRPPHVQVLAQRLMVCIDKVEHQEEYTFIGKDWKLKSSPIWACLEGVK